MVWDFFVADKMTLHIPDVDLEAEVNELCSSPETLEKLEQCVMNWQTSITVVLEEQQHKKPQVCGSTMFRVPQMALVEDNIKVSHGPHMNEC